MPVETQIKELLTNTFHPSYFEVVNESSKHAGHVSSPDSGNSHFKILIVSEHFAGKSKVAQHQMVYECLKKFMDKPIHALSLKTYTPEEFKSRF